MKKETEGKGFNWYIFVPSFLFLFCGAVYFGNKGQPAQMGLAIVAGAIGMAFSSLDKFEFFKGAGFEAKTREFKQAVDEGKIILDKLRKITLFTCESVLTQEVASGRMGKNEELAKKTRNDIENILKDINATEDEENTVRKYTIFDFYHHILESTIPSGVKPEQVKEWQALRELGIENPADPQSLREFLKDCGFLSEEKEEQLKDYEHYLVNFEHRRPDEWKKRND